MIKFKSVPEYDESGWYSATTVDAWEVEYMAKVYADTRTYTYDYDSQPMTELTDIFVDVDVWSVADKDGEVVILTPELKRDLDESIKGQILYQYGVAQ